ncbi:VOC family protein [Tabrizicola sp.]|uniref:VOC family protein n=1 Tax=Tabrizicola sp. TaxID=2005166 RepID=UPI003F2CA590
MNILATTLSLVVGDPAASTGFLTEHFGFREVLAFDGGAAVEHPGGGPTLFFLREGLATLDPSQRHVLAQGITLALTVEDIDAEIARLRTAGVQPTFDIRQDDWGERHVQIADPNGLILQLVQWVGGRLY